MSAPFRIAIAGLGTVGAGVVALLRQHPDLLTARCGRPVELVAVSARSKGKDRGVTIGDVAWLDDPVALGAMDGVDAVLELMGGSEGAAKALVEQAIAHGKHVITANKALIAHHGVALAQSAEAQGVMLAFEAAVAGGIPIIDVLRHGVSANRIDRVAGILNGTCNYILSTMKAQGRDFDDVLSEAQALGYAEADPSFDVDGVDAAHKLAILTSLAFGVPVDLDSIHIEGIRTITKRDMAYTDELGYAIRLLGIAEHTPDGIRQRVHPCLVPKPTPIARVEGAFNAVQLQCSAAGRVLLEGAGAGAGPTASAVMSDVVQVARGVRYHPFTLPVAALHKAKAAPIDTLVRGYYLRLTVADKPGVLAEITSIFARQTISVQSLIQHTHDADAPAEIVITTYDTAEHAMQQALQQIGRLDSVLKPAHMIRIEPL